MIVSHFKSSNQMYQQQIGFQNNQIATLKSEIISKGKETELLHGQINILKQEKDKQREYISDEYKEVRGH